jgi:hypothetical protein
MAAPKQILPARNLTTILKCVPWDNPVYLPPAATAASLWLWTMPSPLPSLSAFPLRPAIFPTVASRCRHRVKPDGLPVPWQVFTPPQPAVTYLPTPASTNGLRPTLKAKSSPCEEVPALVTVVRRSSASSPASL